MPEHQHWMDKPGLMRALWTIFALVLAVLVIAEFFVVHEPGGVIGSLGFHAWFGLAVGGIAIAASKMWKAVFKRKDTYYD